MDNQQSSPSVTVDIGPTFGSDIDRIRDGQISWLADIDGANNLIFALDIPLELVGAVLNTSQPTDSVQNMPTSLEFMQRGEVSVRGLQPDSQLFDILCAGGGMNMSVDSLSRSILLADVDERTFVDQLRAHGDITAEELRALQHQLLVPDLFDTLDDAAATQATTHLKANIQEHEREHVRDLIKPSTALWRELELYWCTVLVCTKSVTWLRPEILNRIAMLSGTPSRFTSELLAILKEPYAIDNPAIKRATGIDIAAQRDTGNRLLQFLIEHNIDPEIFAEVLRSPEGEQYCDLWLAYVLDRLRSGDSIDEIDPSAFHDLQNTTAAPYGGIVCDPEFRTDFVDFIRARSRGPVFEVVRLKFVDEEFVLERAWYSLNDRASATESLVAVRRVLFRRQFFPQFTDASGLLSIRTERETAVKNIIQGTSLEETSLFDLSSPDPEELHDHLASTHEAVAGSLLGPHATSDDLQKWLNDPEYGFTP